MIEEESSKERNKQFSFKKKKSPGWYGLENHVVVPLVLVHSTTMTAKLSMYAVLTLGSVSLVPRNFSMAPLCLDLLCELKLLRLVSALLETCSDSDSGDTTQTWRPEPGEGLWGEPCKAGNNAVWTQGSHPSFGKPWHNHLAGSLLTVHC